MEDWNRLAEALGYIDEEEMLRDLYEEEGLSYNRIAKKLGAARWTISRRLTLYGIEKRARGGPNNVGRIKNKLHLLDQRLVFRSPLTKIAKLLGGHTTTIYKYKKAVAGTRLDRKVADETQPSFERY